MPDFGSYSSILCPIWCNTQDVENGEGDLVWGCRLRGAEGSTALSDEQQRSWPRGGRSGWSNSSIGRHPLWNDDAGQSVTTSKGVIRNVRHAGRYDVTCPQGLRMENQRGLIFVEEHPIDNAIKRIGRVEGNGGQVEAIPESPARNVRDACRNHDVSQSLAVVKCMIFDAQGPIVNDRVRQAGALGKRFVGDDDNTARDREACNICAAKKRVGLNGGDRVTVRAARDGHGAS
jgi:hypothetical protein